MAEDLENAEIIHELVELVGWYKKKMAEFSAGFVRMSSHHMPPPLSPTLSTSDFSISPVPSPLNSFVYPYRSPPSSCLSAPTHSLLAHQSTRTKCVISMVDM
ncbi:hypothetical protein PENTCL1PPCAC_7311 [Pristionchus entomophagus]|uniref:Uncharacterized protein n=1 Tax=Pristionchus entomophagus TaxID=358040 RepID=A0AAV5SP60_9BILA|nr:hypothetical protein PENTCL1PPCAC_7311 [Pristionchus entomophagus]